MSSKSAAAILQRQFKDLTDPKKEFPHFTLSWTMTTFSYGMLV